jgi:hypothetical protein
MKLDFAVVDCPRDTKLGGQENVLAAFRMHSKPLADKHFAIPIFLGSIPEGCTQLPSPIQDLEAFLIRPGFCYS